MSMVKGIRGGFRQPPSLDTCPACLGCNSVSKSSHLDIAGVLALQIYKDNIEPKGTCSSWRAYARLHGALIILVLTREVALSLTGSL
jgi:hypothetical protein